MKKLSIFITAIALAAQFSQVNLLESTGICDEVKSVKEAAPKQVYTAAETKNFQTLTKETLKALAGGKKDEMIAKLTDLETAWDDQEKALRPKDEATWTMLDKTLDQAITALRSSHTNLDKGKAALEALLAKLVQSTKP